MFGRSSSFFLAQHLARQDAKKRGKPDRPIPVADPDISVFLRAVAALTIVFIVLLVMALVGA